MKDVSKILLFTTVLTSITFSLPAQFIDHFDGDGAPEGWVFDTGDGRATIDFKQKNGIATLYVDATRDQMNIWWALTRRRISGLDMRKLIRPEYELRVEARIRVSHAPRRVNLHVNHQRTTDFHSHLMEFDIPDTLNWHTISMTTRDFDTQSGDSINAHLALMDWGLGKYRVDFDYFRVDVVNRNTVEKDMGMPLPYHPPLADPSTFSLHVDAAHDAVIDKAFPEKNFNDWSVYGRSNDSGTQFVILRWDLRALKGKKVKRAGLLELSPHSVQRSTAFRKDFGMIRITEILAGDPAWNDEEVTYDNLKGSQRIDHVINTQMIIDDSVTWNAESKVLFTISQPVLQRLIDGKTKGIAILPLGAVNASFYTRENTNTALRPRLHLEVE
jgi:hypothetical protein